MEGAGEWKDKPSSISSEIPPVKLPVLGGKLGDCVEPVGALGDCVDSTAGVNLLEPSHRPKTKLRRPTPAKQ